MEALGGSRAPQDEVAGQISKADEADTRAAVSLGSDPDGEVGNRHVRGGRVVEARGVQGGQGSAGGELVGGQGQSSARDTVMQDRLAAKEGVRSLFLVRLELDKVIRPWGAVGDAHCVGHDFCLSEQLRWLRWTAFRRQFEL